ncbi:hypothetical protein GCM10029963_25530 [Micromonospora andamanensis]
MMDQRLAVRSPPRASGSAITTLWSPAGTRWVTRQSRLANAPPSSGTPNGPDVHPGYAANRSIPLVAKTRAASA